MDPSNSSDVNTAFRDANSLSTGNYGYGVREAVGVFSVPEALERAVDMYPTEASLRNECATALFQAGKPTEAKSQAQEALELNESNHRWGHTDRYLPDATVTRLRQLAAGT